MALVGVLIFLISLRIRPKNRVDRLADRLRRDSGCFDGQSLSSVTMNKRQSHDASEWLDTRLVDGSEVGQMALTDRVWSATSRIEELPELEQSSTGWLLGDSTGDFKPTGRLGSESALSDNNRDWTPAGRYGEGHQAAIETALSIVLTASTLVGFRAHHTNPSHCCLHHAIQLTKASRSIASKTVVLVSPPPST